MNFKSLSTIVHEQLNLMYNQVIADSLIQVNKTRKDFEGDITLVVFPLLKISKKKPELTAEEIGEYLVKNLANIDSYNVVKGFLNLVLSNKFMLNNLALAIKSGLNYGDLEQKNETVIVEYSSPNTNKPLHLGHVRNILLGYSVSEILKANGYDVIKTQIINDRGIHICKSMLAWQKYGEGETPHKSEVKGDKLIGKYYVRFNEEYKKEIKTLTDQGIDQKEAEQRAPILLEAREMLQKWEQSDPEVIELWKMMNGWVYEGFDVTYKNLGVDFDKLYYESETYLLGKELVTEGVQKNIFQQEEDQSIWCDLTNDGLDKKLLLRSDGTSLYITQDMGTAVLRYRDYPNTIKQIYTVGNEQDYHFKVLFKVLDKLGYEWAKDSYHLSYGMMELPSGKMKSREGTVVDADDLMFEMYSTAKQKTIDSGKLEDLSENKKDELYWSIGLGALKYFILKVDPRKKMLFNPEESVDFQGNTGPFIQYTHARTKSIASKVEALSNKDLNENYELRKEEKEVIKVILDFPNIIKDAGSTYSPALIANYLFELAKTYNQFYHGLPILKGSDEEISFRVTLTQKTGQILQRGLTLLGISAPEQM